jgi:hypothetical protein
MKNLLITLTLLLLTTIAVNAQTLKGQVLDGPSNNPMSNVFIRNTTNNQMTLTDKKGNFEIKAASGNLLTFNAPTYISDTLYIIDLKPKKVRMVSLGISLSEVSISGKRLPFDPKTDYRQIYEKAKVYPLSPTSWFGAESRNARRLKKYFKREVQEREIDDAFSKAYVTSLIPLRGAELDNFMTLYRPSYDFVKSNNEQSMSLYINDSYKKYLALPPEKRQVQKLEE